MQKADSSLRIGMTQSSKFGMTSLSHNDQLQKLRGFEAEPRLAASSQARCQSLWEIRGEDAVLRAFQVVGRPLKRHGPGIGVEDGEPCAPVSVPRLAHRTRIDQVADAAAEWKLGDLALTHRAVRRAVGVAGWGVEGKRALKVSVSEEGEWRSGR